MVYSGRRVNEADYDGSKDWFGKSNPNDPDAKTDNLDDLGSICSGLVGVGTYQDPAAGENDVQVKNRYIFPISLTTISDSQNKLYNSYGYDK